MPAWTYVKEPLKDFHDYELIYHYTLEALNDGAEYLDDLASDAYGGERARLKIEANNMRAERDMCKRKREAFWAGKSQIRVPTAAEYQQASLLADQVDTLINESKVAEKMIALGTQLFALFNKLNKP